ncbi:type II toxin-antitoxin system prevent-host-death family antitoxin [Streptomyces sp. NPDC060027]|uniref:type II toxin-antitoxin system prevent-host-death family antitoxin n=1 Tax=Streptomyces sp. NPDC060027 TaxID=3347040 RepID=UPI0036B8CA4B
MAADQGIRIADDGIAEVSMTDARANLTQLLRDVRYGKRSGAFTERGERSAYVVPPEFYEQAIRDRAIIDELHRRTEDRGDDASPHYKNQALTIRNALHSAALAVDD